MTPDQMINVLVTVTLVELMVAIGLAVTLADVVAVATNRRLVLQSAPGELRVRSGGRGGHVTAVPRRTDVRRWYSDYRSLAPEPRTAPLSPRWPKGTWLSPWD